MRDDSVQAIIPTRELDNNQDGVWVSELLPETASMVDELAVLRTVNTEAINHDPAITFINTGVQQPGRPSRSGGQVSVRQPS